jgi:hypothetical protein
MDFTFLICLFVCFFVYYDRAHFLQVLNPLQNASLNWSELISTHEISFASSSGDISFFHLFSSEFFLVDFLCDLSRPSYISITLLLMSDACGESVNFSNPDITVAFNTSGFNNTHNEWARKHVNINSKKMWVKFVLEFYVDDRKILTPNYRKS